MDLSAVGRCRTVGGANVASAGVALRPDVAGVPAQCGLQLQITGARAGVLVGKMSLPGAGESNTVRERTR